MSEFDRDPVIARALGSVTVPDHEPGFWDELSSRLAEEDGSAGAGGAGGGAGGPVPLLGRRMNPARRPWPYLMAAAALVVVLLAAVVLTGPGGDEQNLRTGPAGDTDDTTTTVPEPDPDPTTTTTAPPATTSTTAAPGTAGRLTSQKRGKATADEAVIAWIEAIGAGKYEAAAALVGPRTEAYYKAKGANLVGVMQESGEGYGAWANTPDRSTTEVTISPTLEVVAISGTWKGEGEDGYRVEAVPVAKDGKDGTWLVEPAAQDPSTTKRLAMVRPSSGDNGFNGLAADSALEATAPGRGTFYFSLDDAAPAKVTGRPFSGGVRGVWDPPGNMRSQSHLLVVAYVDGNVFMATGGIFAVEG